MKKQLNLLQKTLIGLSISVIGIIIIAYNWSSYKEATNLILIFIGLVLVVWGIIFLNSALNAAQELTKNGIKIQGKILYIYKQVSPPQLGQNSAGQHIVIFRIIAEGLNPITNQKGTFTSDAFYDNQPIIDITNNFIDIYIDQKNSEKYYVDIRKVPTSPLTVEQSQKEVIGNYRSYDGKNFSLDESATNTK